MNDAGLLSSSSVTSERDLAADLAEEIRAAVAQAAPTLDRQSAPTDVAAGQVHGSLGRARAYLTPAVPEGARLSGVKGLLLRAFRFLWRDQAAFNALVVEAAAGLVEEIADARFRLRNLETHVDRTRRDLQSAFQEFDRRHQELSSSVERLAAIQDGRLAILEANQGAAGAPPPPARVPALPPGVYSLFEERFRGSPEEIADRQEFYLPLLEGLPGPVLDAGCGRGEFLSLLRERGISASGVESSPIAAGACRAAGLLVEQEDALAALSRRPNATLGAVVAFQVVEHWSAETTFAFLREARRALAPGGAIILETINTDSLSALRAFFLDPSHVRPVPPEALRFLAEAAGFGQARVEFRAPLPDAERLRETSENEAKLNRLLFGPQDYALVAYVPDGREP